MTIEGGPDETKGDKKEGGGEDGPGDSSRLAEGIGSKDPGARDQNVDEEANDPGHGAKDTEGPAIGTDDHELHDGCSDGLALPGETDEEVEKERGRDAADADPEEVEGRAGWLDLFEVGGDEDDE